MVVVKMKTEAKYNGHDVKPNKAVNVNFKAPYAELKNYIQSIQLLNENVTIAAKIGSDKKPIKLGTFMINNINIDRDGEGKFKFNSMIESAELANLNEIAERNDEPLVLLLKADIDIDDDEDQEDDDEE